MSHIGGNMTFDIVTADINKYRIYVLYFIILS